MDLHAADLRVDILLLYDSSLLRTFSTKSSAMKDGCLEDSVSQFETTIREANEKLVTLFFPYQKKYHQCCVTCFDRFTTLDEIEQCMNKCSEPLANLKQKIEGEMKCLEKEIQVCQEKCQHSNWTASSSNRPEHETALKSCMMKCFSKALHSCKEMENRMFSLFKQS
jgi:hypothetical protein